MDGNFYNKFNGIALAHCDGGYMGLPRSQGSAWQILCWGTKNMRYVAIAINLTSTGLYWWDNGMSEFSKLI